MKEIYIPDGAKYIIETLAERGYDAYIVGGCVRDALLSRHAEDYDITTSALPDTIKASFDKTVDTGIAHGTVSVIYEGATYEVTTYRIDGEYKDMRRPESVSFTANLADDLARRDFTVNAMAYNERDGLVDEYGGLDDLEKRMIRAVGDPNLRFTEDALRILRGIRFASTLGFSIEENTASAIRKLASNLRGVSSERILVEWRKLLGGDGAFDVITDYIDVIRVFFPEIQNFAHSREAFCSLSAEHRFVSLFVGNGGASAFVAASSRLKSDNKTKERGVAILDALRELEDGGCENLRLYLIGKDDSVSLDAAEIGVKLGMLNESIYREVKSLIESDSVRRINQLSVGGKELLSMGIRGEAIGRALSDMLECVADGKLSNERDVLLSYVSDKYL